MPNLFEIAARKRFRFNSPQGLLTTEQLFGLPLTSVSKANLNDVAIGIADELDKAGTRSFVTTASTDPARTELNEKLELVKFVIADREAANARERELVNKRQQREVLLDAIAAAERRELGSKSPEALRAELAALDG
jgi:hypothetical protein